METEYRGYIPDGGISTCFCAIAQRGLVRLIPEFTSGPSEAVFSAPSMGAILEVEVLPLVDHSERSEAQLRKGD